MLSGLRVGVFQLQRLLLPVPLRTFSKHRESGDGTDPRPPKGSEPELTYENAQQTIA